MQVSDGWAARQTAIEVPPYSGAQSARVVAVPWGHSEQAGLAARPARQRLGPVAAQAYRQAAAQAYSVRAQTLLAQAVPPVCGLKPLVASQAVHEPSVQAAPVLAAVRLVMGAAKADAQAMSVPRRCSAAVVQARQGAAASLVYGAVWVVLFQQYAGTARALLAVVQTQQYAAQVRARRNLD